MTRGRFEIVPRRAMAAGLYRELVALCGEAYEEDFTELMEGYGPDAVHVVGLDGDTPVTHALWVPCRLRAGSGTLLAASVEALATRPSHLGRGLASAVMRLVVEETGRAGFDLCVLWAFDVAWYERLGWELWRGQVAQIGEDGLEPLTGDDVMIHRLPRTPVLDLDAPLVVEA